MVSEVGIMEDYKVVIKKIHKHCVKVLSDIDGGFVDNARETRRPVYAHKN